MADRRKSKGGARLAQNMNKTTNSRHHNEPRSESVKPMKSATRSRKSSRSKKVAVFAGVTLAVVAFSVVLIAVAANRLNTARDTRPALRLELDAPREVVSAVNEPSTSSDSTSEGVDNSGSESQPVLSTAIRDKSKYTFLILGSDAAGGNTDTIMVATFDIDNFTLDVVNIPRDTLVNVSWSLKKANSILPNMRRQHRGEQDAELRAMDATAELFSDILGFKVDYWVVLNFRAFSALVDAVGGINFNVPFSITYYGFTVNAGQQRLNGRQALIVIRNRDFATADIGRMMITQNFMTAAMNQIIAQRNSIRVPDMARVFLNNVVTDMSVDDLIFFGERFLQMNSDNIRFHMMPGFVDTLQGSYVTILVDEWLTLLNAYINPFYGDKTLQDVSILARDSNRRLFVTDGNWRGNPQWRADTLGPANPRCITTYGVPRR